MPIKRHFDAGIYFVKFTYYLSQYEPIWIAKPQSPLKFNILNMF